MDWSLEPLDPRRDWDATFAVLQASEDFALLSEGRPATADTANDFFASAPPRSGMASTLKLGVRNIDGRLVGLVEIARGFPDPETWYIGLLLLVPAERGNGLGSELVAEIERRARREGARKLRLVVLEENLRALKFWSRQGFVEARRYPPRLSGLKMHGRVEMDFVLLEGIEATTGAALPHHQNHSEREFERQAGRCSFPSAFAKE